MPLLLAVVYPVVGSGCCSCCVITRPRPEVHDRARDARGRSDAYLHDVASALGKAAVLPIGPGFEEVLAAAQSGAPWAFARLYEDLAPAITGYLRLRGAPEPDDTASEAMLQVFRALPRFTGDEAAFRSWVFTIVHRRLIDDRRRRGRRPTTAPLEAGEAEAGGNVELEALEALDPLGGGWMHDALRAVTDDQRDVLLLRIVGGLSVEEVAGIVGKRPGAVRALQHRALGRLRERLAEQRITTREE